MGKGKQQNRGEEELRKIYEEYKIWKSNTAFLYDMVITHALEWPSITVDWLPGKYEEPGKNYSTQNLILGTHTSHNEPNYLILAQVLLPQDDSENDSAHHYISSESGGAGGTGRKVLPQKGGKGNEQQEIS